MNALPAVEVALEVAVRGRKGEADLAGGERGTGLGKKGRSVVVEEEGGVGKEILLNLLLLFEGKEEEGEGEGKEEEEEEEGEGRGKEAEAREREAEKEVEAEKLR